MSNLPLTVTQRDQLAALLAGQLARRRQQLALRQDGSSFVDHALAERQQDGDDVMHRDGGREVDSALSDRDLADIDQLGAAMGRIAVGQYGTCADCGAPIGVARLLAEPAALRCAACEAGREQQRTAAPHLPQDA